MEHQFHCNVLGFDLTLKSTKSCFSPKGIDKGTTALLESVHLQYGRKILDLGCGYGVVGIACAKIVGQENVVMSDIDVEALACAKENAKENGVSDICILQSNAFENMNESDFDIILSNPPYHADFCVPKMFIEKGFNRLKIGGIMLMVTKRKEWYKQKFISIFGGVHIHETDGYFVFCAEKKGDHYGKNRENG